MNMVTGNKPLGTCCSKQYYYEVIYLFIYLFQDPIGEYTEQSSINMNKGLFHSHTASKLTLRSYNVYGNYYGNVQNKLFPCTVLKSYYFVIYFRRSLLGGGGLKDFVL